MPSNMYLKILSFAIAITGLEAQFNNPTGVDIWCGKAYRPSNASFNPGGSFDYPTVSAEPLLRLIVKPRMSIYLDTDTEGSLVVDARISRQLGAPIASKYASESPLGGSAALQLEILSGARLLTTGIVNVGSRDNEIPLDLRILSASMRPYNITLRATLPSGAIYTASTDLYRLPYPEDYGSVSRIDNLLGGLWVQQGKMSIWKPIFPYTYYVQWSLYWDSNVTTLDEFAGMGYNMIHIVPTGSLGDSSFPWDEFQPYLDRAKDLGLFLQYDVIWSPTNDTSMIEQVSQLRTHPSILLWYQSDEPDGKSSPTNSTGIAREKLWQLDPYHPSSLALNCFDFYYSDYAKGGEVIISDVYPISTNTSWSTVYETPCNATYGCCGCDDCNGVFEDISDRIDEFYRRDDIIGWNKVHWTAPQAFGNESFWTRYPTEGEEDVMSLLAVNHGAKGLVAWDYPTTSELSRFTQKLAKVMTSDLVAHFLLQTPLKQKLTVRGGSRVDAATWVSEHKKQALLSVVNLNYSDLTGTIKVILPEGVKAASVAQTLWGDASWHIDNGDTLAAAAGLRGLQVSIVVLDLDD